MASGVHGGGFSNREAVNMTETVLFEHAYCSEALRANRAGSFVVVPADAGLPVGPPPAVHLEAVFTPPTQDFKSSFIEVRTSARLAYMTAGVCVSETTLDSDLLILPPALGQVQYVAVGVAGAGKD